MKISLINFDKKIEKLQNNNISSPTFETKQVETSADKIKANYNIAFSGLLKKETVPQYDATRLTFEHKMEKNVPYLISEDSEFLLGNFWLNLKNEREKTLIQNLKKGEELIFGREATNLQGMTIDVSRQHLKIEKTKAGKLIATDLGSVNGTTILPNIQKPMLNSGQFGLFPNKKYLFPTNSVFGIDGYTLNLSNFHEEISAMEDGQKKNFTVFNEIPLQIEKFGNNVIAQNLSNTINTSFLYLDETAYVNDFSEIYAPATLQRNVPTLIPANSQLRLGQELTIDTRDKKINELLAQKRKILIGRNECCDYIVNGFNDQVSNRHLLLERTSKGLVVTDLGSTNSTMVIPQQHIKAFYNEINGLALKQGNIGDCTLLSALYSLSLNPKGKEIIKNMVSIDEDGGYIVQFPNYRGIKVPLENLYGQENKKGERKIAVESELGIRAIERAYAKYLNRYGDYGPTMFGVIDKGAELRTPLYNLTNISPKTTKVNQLNIDSVFRDIAQSGGTYNHVVTCSTPNKGKYGDYLDYQRRFIKNHAYSIKNIDPYSRTVEVVNPHNTKYYCYTLSFDEFIQYFSEVCDLNL